MKTFQIFALKDQPMAVQSNDFTSAQVAGLLHNMVVETVMTAKPEDFAVIRDETTRTDWYMQVSASVDDDDIMNVGVAIPSDSTMDNEEAWRNFVALAHTASFLIVAQQTQE